MAELPLRSCSIYYHGVPVHLLLLVAANQRG